MDFHSDCTDLTKLHESTASHSAATHARTCGAIAWDGKLARADADRAAGVTRELDFNPAEMLVNLQSIMADDVGPFRTAAGLQRALDRIGAMRAALGEFPPHDAERFDAGRIDWIDLRNMLLVAETVARAALLRTESRGAHQREDHPGLEAGWTLNQVVALRGGAIAITQCSVATPEKVAA